MNPVEQYIYEQENSVQELMVILYDICVNDFGLEPKIKFKIPFFYGASWVCYINKLKKGGIEFCFVNANKFHDPSGLLLYQNRKQVAGIIYHKSKEINLESLFSILQKATEYDQTLSK